MTTEQEQELDNYLSSLEGEIICYNNQTTLRQRISNFQQDDVFISKSKQAYGYKYAPLDVILPLINPYLKKHGIGFYHSTEQRDVTFNGTQTNSQFLKTTFFRLDAKNLDYQDIITCETLINEKVQLAKMNEFMVVGSAITYYRRYHVVTVLGLITDEDSDAGGSQPSTKQNTTTKSKPQTTTSKTASSGRSVEKAQTTEDTVDYVSIIDNVSRNKDEKTTRKTFDMYKKNMSKEIQEKCLKVINDKFKN